MDRDRRTATAPRSTQVETRAGGDLFIVDNSDEDWKALQYLREWAQISTAFDIATGFLEIGALLALDGEWQKLDKIRILMGAETTKRTRQALLEALRTAATEQLDESIEKVKEQNDFLKAFLSALAGKTGLGFVESGASDKGFGAEDAFHYIYAVLWSPWYRQRYEGFLRLDFPRVPFPASAQAFRTLVRIGRKLVDAHAIRALSNKEGSLDNTSADLFAFCGVGSNEVASGFPKHDGHNKIFI